MLSYGPTVGAVIAGDAVVFYLYKFDVPSGSGWIMDVPRLCWHRAGCGSPAGAGLAVWLWRGTGALVDHRCGGGGDGCAASADLSP
jgi:hypothetical protein